MSMGTLPYFIGFKMSNSVRNTMTVNKIFHKSKDVGFGRSVMESISRESTPKKVPPLA